MRIFRSSGKRANTSSMVLYLANNADDDEAVFWKAGEGGANPCTEEATAATNATAESNENFILTVV